MGEKHRAGLGAERCHMSDPIVLLLGSGLFVAFNMAGLIGGDGSPAGETGLRVTGHFHAVDKIAWVNGAYQAAVLDKSGKIVRGSSVYFRSIGVGSHREIDFGARNMEKVGWLAGSEGARLLGSHHVIGRRNYIRCTILSGEQGIEWSDQSPARTGFPGSRQN